MEVAEFLAAVVVTNFGSHLIFHAVPHLWRRAARRRQMLGVRRLDDLARQIETLKQPRAPEPAEWRASNYRKYYVPVGLRLGDARRIVHASRHPPGG